MARGGAQRSCLTARSTGRRAGSGLQRLKCRRLESLAPCQFGLGSLVVLVDVGADGCVLFVMTAVVAAVGQADDAVAACGSPPEASRSPCLALSMANCVLTVNDWLLCRYARRWGRVVGSGLLRHR